MQRSIYLAKLIGPVFVAMGLGMLLNGAAFRVLIEEFLHNYALIYLTGLLTLPVGIAIVLAHNVWVGDWRLIITVLGWLGTIGGVFRIMFPQVVKRIGTSVFSHAEVLMIGGFGVLVLGGVLSYFGYQEFFGGRGSRTTRKRTRR